MKRDRVDLVLVHPDSSPAYRGLAELAAVEPPLWALMLASYVRRVGYQVEVVDAEAEHLSPSQVALRVAEYDPLAVAIVVYGHHPSASTQVMPAASAVASTMREWPVLSSTRIILVGGHAAALPERTAAEEPVDFVVTGEGFATLARLCQVIRQGGDPALVPGLVWRMPGRTPGGEVVVARSRPAPNVANLDLEVPRPAHDLVDLKRYRAHNWHALGDPDGRSPYASIYTTLGCPYSCSFCCIQAPFREGDNGPLVVQGVTDGKPLLGPLVGPPSYRRWSPPRVARTLAQLRDRGVRHVKIADEMFVLNRNHVEGVCEAIGHEGLTDLNLWAYARVDTVGAGLPEKLKAAGFRWLAFGIESAAESVRDRARKSFTLTQTRETIDRVRGAGIHVIANYIFGLPGETLETMQETLDLAGELNTEFANFYCAAAYPGSALYQEADPARLPRSWGAYHQHSAEFRPTWVEGLDPAEVVAFRDRAWRVYHGSSRYLDMLERTFGRLAVDQVRAAAGVPWTRRGE